MKHKYKVTFFTGHVVKFKSRYHLSKMEFIPTPKGSYVHFDDAKINDANFGVGTGIVLDLEQVKFIEINGIRYEMQAYQVH